MAFTEFTKAKKGDYPTHASYPDRWIDPERDGLLEVGSLRIDVSE